MAYREQFERVQRFLVRIESVNPKLELVPEEQLEQEDMLWAFFQNSWHLKDWIASDDAAPTKLSKPIERLCKQYPSLMICADLANRTKHFRLKKPPRVDAKVIRQIAVQVGDSAARGESTSMSEVRYRYTIVDNTGKSYDVLEIARQAVKDWKNLISSNGGTLS